MPVYSVSVYSPTVTYRVKAKNEEEARNRALEIFSDEDGYPQVTGASWLYDEGDYDIEGFEGSSL